MEQKDLIQLKGKLREEYLNIERTDFWKDYIGRINDELEIAIGHCLTDRPESVPMYQGSVAAIKKILSLPSKDVLEVTMRKGKSR